MWQTERLGGGENGVESIFRVPPLVGQAGPATPETAAADPGSVLEQLAGSAMLTSLIDKYLVPAVGALLIVIVAWFVARFLARIGSAPIRHRVDETLGRFVSKIIFWSVMIFAMLGVLGMFGVSVASFAAVLASVGFAVGLAFQGSLSNFAAGVLLLVLRPFKVGDVIETSGITATVNEIDLFTTTLDTPDNRRVTVPNSSVLSGNIENFSWHSERRAEVVVGVDYTADLRRTRQALQAAADALSELTVPGEGRGTQIVLASLGDSAVIWKVRLWTRTGDYWTVQERLAEAVKQSLDQQQIGIPFPQLDVHLRGDSRAA